MNPSGSLPLGSSARLPESEGMIKMAFLKLGLAGFVDKDLLVTVKGGIKFKIHKKVLSRWSQTGRKQILAKEQDRKDKAALITVKLPVDADAFDTIIKIMYIGDVNDGTITFTGAEHAFRVLESALILKVNCDWEALIKRIVPYVGKDNAINALKLADCIYGSRPEILSLWHQALQVVLDNGEALLCSNEFLQLGLSAVRMILGSDALRVSSELDVYNAIHRWTMNHTESLRTYQNVFNNLKETLRFELMTHDELFTVENNVFIENLDVLENNFRYFLPKRHPQYLKPRKRTPAAPCPTQATHHIMDEAIEHHSSTLTPNDIMHTDGRPRSNDRLAENMTEQSESNSLAGNDISPSTSRTLKISTLPPQHQGLRLTLWKRTLSETFEETRKRVAFSQTPKATANQEILSDDHDLFNVVVKWENQHFPSFDSLYHKSFAIQQNRENQQKLSSIEMANSTVAAPYAQSVLPICQDVKIDVDILSMKLQGTQKLKLLDFVSTFDPLRFIGTFKKKDNLELKTLWDLEQNVLLCFNGINFFKLQHKNISTKKEDTLTLNYIKNAIEVCENPNMRLDELSLSNCPFSMTTLPHSFFGCLKTVNLYKCWGTFSLDQLVANIPSLENLYFWKLNDPSCCMPCLDIGALKPAKYLKTLAVCEVSLTETLNKRIGVPCHVKNLTLDNCKYELEHDSGASFGLSFIKIFANLESLSIMTENGNNDTLLPYTVFKYMSKLEQLSNLEIFCTDDATLDHTAKTAALYHVLSHVVDPPERNTNRISFLSLGKDVNNISEKNWNTLMCHTRDSLPPNMIESIRFERFHIDAFYKDAEIYSQYFLGTNDNFPRKILWA